MINTFKTTTVILIITLSACAEQNQASTRTAEQLKTDELHQQFQQWKKHQNPQQLKKYQDYLAKNLKNPPNLFDISINRHLSKPECLQYRFAIAPESQWKNLVDSLKLIEKLQQQKIIGQYTIVSVYRSPVANQCSRGAKASKHLTNSAVDFQILDPQGRPYAQINVLIQQRLCDFWRKYGTQYQMGLGTYPENKYHIDTKGYRTWGKSYKHDSSLCLK